MSYFARNLENLRKYFRFTQRDVAEAGDVTQAAANKIEKAKIVPSIETAKGIAELFGVTIDEMINTPPDELKSAVIKRRET